MKPKFNKYRETKDEYAEIPSKLWNSLSKASNKRNTTQKRDRNRDEIEWNLNKWK